MVDTADFISHAAENRVTMDVQGVVGH